MSRLPGCTGRDSLQLRPPGPNPLGSSAAAEPHAWGFKLIDTPGALGKNDCADPDLVPGYTLGVRGLHVTLSRDKDLLIWDYDPNDLLEDDRLSPEFVEQAHRGLKTAVSFGLRPKVHEAYRSPAESDRKHALWKKKQGGKAAPGWQSVHNYGLAMDVWLYDRRHHHISNKTKGWYPLYKLLAKACSPLLWGEPFDDADHFEYHPNWKKPAKGTLLIPIRDWAMRAAVANGKLVQYDAGGPANRVSTPTARLDAIPEADINWLPYFWWAAGAGRGEAPPDAYLASNPPPTQV